MDLGLTGKKAIVTGSTKGIGRAIAETLLDEGASVAICARDADGVEQAVAELQPARHGVGQRRRRRRQRLAARLRRRAPSRRSAGSTSTSTTRAASRARRSRDGRTTWTST